MNARPNLTCRLFALLLIGLHAGLAAQSINAGTINTYARVTAVAGNVLTVNSATISGFGTTTAQYTASGSRALVIQMRGATANTAVATTDATYGNLSALNSAGRYEFVEVTGVTATTITLASALSNAYDVPAGDVQIVHVPHYTTDQTLTTALTAPTWSATTGLGGVVAVVVNARLTISANISADGLGFAGGVVSLNGITGFQPCVNGTYASGPGTAGTNTAHAGKGQSLVAQTPATNGYARGRWISGGGGGNVMNAGGGGGGNFTAGGTGGNGIYNGTQVTCSSAEEGGRGLGGAALSYDQATVGARLYFGGGGGGGQGDTGDNTPGGNGGGIVIVRAFTLSVSGARSITANGANSNSSTNAAATDAAGGAGAGGAILMDVTNWDIATGACGGNTLLISTNGGNGGASASTTTTPRGGGGGGGAGFIGLTATAPTATCVTFSSTAGTPGLSCVGTGCTAIGSNPGTTITAPSGCPATNCAGGPVVVPGTPVTLPIVLTSLSGQRQGSDVLLTWATASELNNSHFVVERNGDGQRYTFLTTVPGAGTTQSPQRYTHADREAPSDDLYYRLLQIDFDGTQTIYGPIRVTAESGEASLRVVQNPVRAGQPVAVEVSGSAGRRLELVDLNGRILAYQWVSANASTLVPLYAHDLTNGLYIVRLQGTRLSERVVVE